MRKSSLRAGLCSAVFLMPLDLLVAHGGHYPGPTDTVPPNLGGGGDTTPPGGNPGGSTTPPGPGGSTGNRGPTTPGSKGPTTPGGSSGGGGYSRNKNKESGGFEQWEFWWEANDDAFLDLKLRLRTLTGSTSVSPFNLGRGRLEAVGATQRVSEADRLNVREALLAALASDDADIVDSAAIAVARMSPAEDAAAIVLALVKTLHHAQKSAREAAALALGILGAPEALGTLRELLLDTPAGRQLTGKESEVENLVRAFAAASMGLIGDPSAIADLERVVTDDRLHASSDVKALAIRALGLMKGGQSQLVPFLQSLIEDEALNHVVRAQVPGALAQLAQQPGTGGVVRAVLPTLLARLTNDKSDNDLLRSLAVALGRIATLDDTEVVDTLTQVAARCRDEQTRHFSVMALADIGLRDTEPAVHGDQQKRLQQFFLKEMLQPKPITATPWGALALAVWSRNRGLDHELTEMARVKLAEEFREQNNPSYQAAVAVALGLANATEAKNELLDTFLKEPSQSLRSYTAVGLGLMCANEAAEPLRAVLPKKGLDTTMRLQLARALGLLGDRRAVTDLVANFRTAETQVEAASTAEALGLIGDRAAVDPLLAVLQDEQQSGIRRGFAAVGLGLLAEKSELPWNAVFTVGSNYRARTPALAEIFDIL